MDGTQRSYVNAPWPQSTAMSCNVMTPTAGCPPGTICYSQTAQIIQQASQAQYRADMEQQSRQHVERVHSRTATQHTNLIKQYRAATDRYNQLHKSWVEAELHRKDAEGRMEQTLQTRQALQTALNEEKEACERMNEHLSHALETTRVLARQLYVQQIEQSELPNEKKDEAKTIDITAVFEERQCLQVECNQLRAEIKRLQEEHASQSEGS